MNKDSASCFGLTNSETAWWNNRPSCIVDGAPAEIMWSNVYDPMIYINPAFLRVLIFSVLEHNGPAVESRFLPPPCTFLRSKSIHCAWRVMMKHWSTVMKSAVSWIQLGLDDSGDSLHSKVHLNIQIHDCHHLILWLDCIQVRFEKEKKF